MCGVNYNNRVATAGYMDALTSFNAMNFHIKWIHVSFDVFKQKFVNLMIIMGYYSTNRSGCCEPVSSCRLTACVEKNGQMCSEINKVCPLK